MLGGGARVAAEERELSLTESVETGAEALERRLLSAKGRAE